MKGSKCKCAGREAAEIIGGLQSEKDMKAQAAGEAGLPQCCPPVSASVPNGKVPKRLGFSHSEERPAGRCQQSKLSHVTHGN